MCVPCCIHVLIAPLKTSHCTVRLFIGNQTHCPHFAKWAVCLQAKITSKFSLICKSIYHNLEEIFKSFVIFLPSQCGHPVSLCFLVSVFKLSLNSDKMSL